MYITIGSYRGSLSFKGQLMFQQSLDISLKKIESISKWEFSAAEKLPTLKGNHRKKSLFPHIKIFFLTTE